MRPYDTRRRWRTLRRNWACGSSCWPSMTIGGSPESAILTRSGTRPIRRTAVSWRRSERVRLRMCGTIPLFMRHHGPDIVVLYEHPDWQKPLFAALERRGLPFEALDLTAAAFSNADRPAARLYFNQASPSAYVRGHTRAVPFALAYMRSLEMLGARVLNGASVFMLELSKSAQ